MRRVVTVQPVRHRVFNLANRAISHPLILIREFLLLGRLALIPRIPLVVAICIAELALILARLELLDWLSAVTACLPFRGAQFALVLFGNRRVLAAARAVTAISATRKHLLLFIAVLASYHDTLCYWPPSLIRAYAASLRTQAGLAIYRLKRRSALRTNASVQLCGAHNLNYIIITHDYQ